MPTLEYTLRNFLSLVGQKKQTDPRLPQKEERMPPGMGGGYLGADAELHSYAETYVFGFVDYFVVFLHQPESI